MAARAYWKGQIRLALVSIPVEIFPATKSGASVAFRQIHEPSGKPIRYEKTVTGIGAIDPGDIVKGFEVSKGNYVLLDTDEIEAVKLESKKTLELVQFVDSGEIDVLYYEKPYFVVPADDLAEEAYIVLREALRKSKKVALGQLAMRGREYIVTLKPCGRGMVLETLRYADEVNRAQGYFRDIPDAKPDDDLLDLANSLIEKKTKAFDPSKFTDHYTDAVKELVARKQKAKGRKVVADEDDEGARPSGSNVVDLMAALKKSLEKPGAKSAPAARKPPAKKPAAKKPAAKPATKAPTRKRA